MSFILDTCAVSELSRQEPNPGVLAWFTSCPVNELYLSVLTVGDLRYGIDRLPEGNKKIDLLNWFDAVVKSYRNAILPIDEHIADRWGTERARLAAKGRSPAVVDALIACTAAEHAFAIVTRNVADFDDFTVRVVNPWE
ncbi:MAG: type II toxin-antitoxin system VapC family toxin [Thermodesulfobacteriota bacterium]|nr:type II toxin-antitoxin system VapC family toxin [Thermodesulfobacteriota bacterium]